MKSRSIGALAAAPGLLEVGMGAAVSDVPAAGVGPDAAGFGAVAARLMPLFEAALCCGPGSLRVRSVAADRVPVVPTAGAVEGLGAGGGAINSSSKASDELSGGCAWSMLGFAEGGDAEGTSSSDKGRNGSSAESGIRDSVS